MTNIEAIKAMSPEKLAKFLNEPVCTHCIYRHQDDCSDFCCTEAFCIHGIIEWLKREAIEEV